MTDAEVLHTRNDLEMIKRPHLWPTRALCLKRLNPVLAEVGDGLPYDYGRLRPDSYRVLVLGNVFEVTGIEEYDSAEAIVAAGWRVD